MDAVRFDRWTKRVVGTLSSRRGLLRLSGGGGLGLLILGQMAEEALACRRNGKPCGSGRNGGCCSGTCKKGKCRPTPGAGGCTVNHDVCKGVEFAKLCPKNSNGVCINLDNGKPFCYIDSACEPCTSNASCVDAPGGKCLKTCGICNAQSGGQACVYPAPVA